MTSWWQRWRTWRDYRRCRRLAVAMMEAMVATIQDDLHVRLTDPQVDALEARFARWIGRQTDPNLLGMRGVLVFLQTEPWQEDVR